jgi:1,4-dihydroxy-2-naphthoyl-CoA hydrolase
MSIDNGGGLGTEGSGAGGSGAGGSGAGGSGDLESNWVAANGAGELADAMGIEFTEFTAERAVARMPVMGNRQTVGYMHGGAYVVLGESLGSMAANLHAGPGRLAIGIDINATHTRSAKQGYVTGVCTPISLGRTIAVHEIVVTDDEGRRCCTIRITNLITDMPAA